MDIDAILEAFQDFEKKGKKDICPVLEHFLCHVAKTGQPMIPWSQFKTYFMFKLEKVMDDFHDSMPEQRELHNPNVEYVPFEEIKKRILKIVDGYNGIPFTIQRLCELLMDPKRNYTGTDKFLRGLEKNVMVVSCVYPSSDRNVNGPGTPKTLHRPKLSLSTSLSTNGLPDCPVSKEPEPTTELEERPVSETAPSADEMSPKSGIKKKLPEEEGESDGDKQDVKRLKFDEKEEDETAREEKEPSGHEGPERASVKPESLEDSSGQEDEGGTSCDSPNISDKHQPGSTQTEPSEREGDSSEPRSVQSDGAVDRSEEPAPTETNTSFEQDSGESSSSSSSSSSDGESLTSDKQVSSSSNSPELSTEGGADISNNPETAIEPGEHD
ncbi:serine/threonine-protein phosphatase 4 regulatory subunit 2-A-like isoform X2 [Leuresthes tenuis]|uniref:serine/threonine-protein phosphatase 4 regulatory subunit 2-A-like isoform X2 n=1 Tax=Leuresthes tenuis TaxID=355514 RepID=UPI003B502439